MSSPCGCSAHVIGDDQDNDGDEWPHETGESFSGRGGTEVM